MLIMCPALPGCVAELMICVHEIVGMHPGASAYANEIQSHIFRMHRGASLQARALQHPPEIP